MNDDNQLFARIAPLFDVGLLGSASVLVAGCGSGGSQVALQLAMSGVRNFSLLDMDVLEAENVIRHVCGLRYVGQDKVDALADVLRDRNPAIQIDRYKEDIMTYAGLADLVKKSTVGILAERYFPIVLTKADALHALKARWNGASSATEFEK
jgi:tRNA A37 threonylcarbamoyladenosine dehydratase